MTKHLLLAAFSVVCACSCDDRSRSSGEEVRPALEQMSSASPQAEARTKTPQGNIFGVDDETIRRTLAEAPIHRVKKGGGGRSLAFRLSFADGTEAYFKPEQRFAANWYSELAAYYLDRELGLGRTPPAIGRRLDWQRISSHVGKDARVGEVVVRNGSVRGSLVWWIPEASVPVELTQGWEAWLRIEPPTSPSPFQGPRDYLRALRQGTTLAVPTTPQPTFADRAAELSDLILFDYLIGNLDRWGSDFVNVRTLGRGEALIYLDNANGFELRTKPSRVLEQRLSWVQRFRRVTVEAIRRLDVRSLERRMASDPLAPLLTPEQLVQLEERRQRALEHVRAMQEAHGAEVLSW